MLVGYMRVSTDGDRQVLDLQRDALLAADVDQHHLFETEPAAAAAIAPAWARRLPSSTPAIAWWSGRWIGSADHLENEGAEGTINRRNGSSRKTMLTATSKVTLDVPRDLAGTFDPKLIAKYQRRFPDFDDKIVSMYARGMTVPEIRGHLEGL